MTEFSSNNEIWQEVKTILSRKLRKPSFETWIKPTQLVEIKDNYAILAVRNDFTRNFLSQSYLEQIQAAIKEATATALGIRIIVDADLVDANSATEEEPKQEKTPKQVREEFATQTTLAHINKPSTISIKSNLNDRYTFDNFISGQSNKLSLAFANALEEDNSNSYQSLLVTAKPGLGKTHLLNAIGNKRKLSNGESKVRYTNAEEFTNELISSIRKNSTYDFRNKYRKLDLLLFDDAHFLEGKKSTQEEFFHTFNSITNNGGQVVMSSAKPLNQLSRLEPNLKSRLEGALATEIMEPEIETRVEILENKALEVNLELAQENLQIIAQKYIHNVRELEAALLKLSVLQQNDVCIDNDLVADLFGSVRGAGEYQGLSIEKISKTVASYFGIKLEEIVGKRRLAGLTKPRHLAIYLAYDLLQISYNRIGGYFSGRKHSSIIHSINTIKSEIGKDRSLALILDDIKTKLKA